MIPPLWSELDWASAIGLFIINFGFIDHLVLDFLESRLPSEEFTKTKELHLQDRIKLVKDLLEKSDYPPEKRERFARFFHDLDPVRELRNHIAHGHLLVRLEPDMKTIVATLSQPKDLDAAYAPETRHLGFDELKGTLVRLNELIEEFRKLTGNAALGDGK